MHWTELWESNIVHYSASRDHWATLLTGWAKIENSNTKSCNVSRILGIFLSNRLPIEVGNALNRTLRVEYRPLFSIERPLSHSPETLSLAQLRPLPANMAAQCSKPVLSNCRLLWIQHQHPQSDSGGQSAICPCIRRVKPLWNIYFKYVD